jgi:hypothetical protein
MSRRSSNGSINNTFKLQQISQLDSINNQTINKDKNFLRFDDHQIDMQNYTQINNPHISTQTNENYINYQTGLHFSFLL